MAAPNPTFYILVLIVLGFGCGAIIGASVFLTLNVCNSGIVFTKDNITIAMFAAGATGALITCIALALHHLFKCSIKASITKKNNENTKLLNDNNNII